MIKMFSAHTSEINDASLAIAEILNLLSLEENLLRNSVGMISCSKAFITSGIVSALCARLPFDVVGFVTSGNTAPGALDSRSLSLSVLSSDDVIFAAGMSQAITPENLDLSVDILYDKLCADLNDIPDLLIPVTPLMPVVGTDEIIESLDDLSNGTPIFGTVSISHSSDFSGVLVTHNGEVSASAMALIAIAGENNFALYVTSILESEVIALHEALSLTYGLYALLFSCINGNVVLGSGAEVEGW